ncbi:MAG TPA: Gfo/Idh/MocA family oxidoreductase [Bryobacteraceae bacterium]|nr:Gfo/Idh/MocA family oxidoreductase [Bryobacteraceae bacterium]
MRSRRSFLAASGATAGSMAAAAQSSSPGGRIRMGVVGGNFGLQFPWHLHPRAKVTAVCDIRPDRLDSMMTTFRCDTKHRSFQEMLKQKDLDAVAIFTPVPMHAWMAVQALRAGKHVISAVVAGMSEEQLVEILDTVRATGLKYMMAETSYYRPEIITCRQWSREGKFGTIFYSEAEYHHEGLIALARDERGFPTWRYGFPPAHYCTHATGMVVPVTGERLSEVQAIGWGDGNEILKTNQYKNPFWNANCFFKTSKGHAARISLCRHIAAGGTERGVFFGDRMTYTMARPEGSPNTVSRIEKEGKTVLDSNGYPEGAVKVEPYRQPNHWEALPESLRVKSGHGGSHTFLVHEFLSAIAEDRHPAVNIWEAIAFTLPGIVAHQSALKGGEPMKIRDYGVAPA